MNLISLTQQFGTPLYVYDLNIVREKYNYLKNCFNYPKTKFFYAMKANYNPAILTTLLKEGANIDAVSPAEVLLALKIGFKPDQILFTANMMTPVEMKEVQELGVLFNIGSLGELEGYGKLYPGNNVCLRFNPDVVAGHHEKVRTGGKDTKFGIRLENLEKAKDICKQYNLTIIGIHEHTGSGIPETVDMVGGMQNILRIITKGNFPHLQFVDFGGGFTIPYHENDLKADYQKFGKHVVKIFEEKCNEFGKDLGLYFEPGRFLVAQSGTLLIQATNVKTNGKNIVGTNSGFAQLIRPMFYNAYHKIRNLTNPEGEVQIYDVAGNICETGDYFATARKLPKVRVDDILAILDAGAYCYSMGGIYNLRSMPSEVVVDGDKVTLTTKRKSNAELVEQILSQDF